MSLVLEQCDCTSGIHMRLKRREDINDDKCSTDRGEKRKQDERPRRETRVAEKEKDDSIAICRHFWWFFPHTDQFNNYEDRNEEHQWWS